MRRFTEGGLQILTSLLFVLSLNACETKKPPPLQEPPPAPTVPADASSSGSPAAQAAQASPVPQPSESPPAAQDSPAEKKLKNGDSVWEGTIGDAPCVLTLRVRGEDVGGRYFYKKHGHSLILSGKQQEGRLVLKEQGGSPEKIFGEVLATLLLNSDGRGLVGTWTAGGGGKSIPVKLSREMKQSYDELRPLTHFGEKEAFGGAFKYESLKSLDEHLIYCKTKKVPPVDVSLIPGLTVLEDECHFAFEGEAGARVIIEHEGVQITQAKEGMKWEEANRKLAFTMLWDPGETWPGSRTTKVIYAGGAVLSVELSTSGLGLGAYPDHDQVGKTLDLRTGEFLEWKDLIDASKFKEFRTALLAQMEPKLSKDCSWSELWSEDDVPELLAPHITSQGLHVTPIFPHVAKACQYEAFGTLVDPSLVKRVAKQGSVLLTQLPAK